MGWNEEKGTAKPIMDSKGGVHYIIFQELSQSCGPASVAMVESQYKSKCMIDPERRARELSQKYDGKWTATGGTGAGNLSYVLNAEGVKTYAVAQVPQNKLWDNFVYFIKEKTPMICHIQWTNSGHFVVCRKVYPDGTIVFLDPWYGLVEVNYANLPNYTPPGANGQLSGWINVTY